MRKLILPAILAVLCLVFLVGAVAQVAAAPDAPPDGDLSSALYVVVSAVVGLVGTLWGAWKHLEAARIAGQVNWKTTLLHLFLRVIREQVEVKGDATTLEAVKAEAQRAGLKAAVREEATAAGQLTSATFTGRRSRASPNGPAAHA